MFARFHSAPRIVRVTIGLVATFLIIYIGLAVGVSVLQSRSEPGPVLNLALGPLRVNSEIGVEPLCHPRATCPVRPIPSSVTPRFYVVWWTLGDSGAGEIIRWQVERS